MELTQDWHCVPGAANYYINKHTHQIWNKKHGRFLKNNPDRSGYHAYCLMSDNGKPKTFLVHRILAQLLIECDGRDKSKLVVNHKDGNKKNNSLENLEWVTPLENSIHGFLNALGVKVLSAADLGNVLKKRTPQRRKPSSLKLWRN